MVVTGAGHGGIPLAAAQVEPSVNEASSIAKAFTQGTLLGALRARYDWVNQEGRDAAAWAATLRAALTFTTKRFAGLTASLELYTNQALDPNSFNGLSNHPDKNYPTISDPASTGVNRAFLQYDNERLLGLMLIVGRQYLHWNDGRFLEDGYYRQNQKKFDAVSVRLTLVPGLQLTYAYFWRYEDVFARYFDQDSHAAQLVYVLPDRLRIGTYVTAINDQTDLTSDRISFGTRVTGPWKLRGDWALHYTAEAARQISAFRNPSRVDALYLVFEAGVVKGPWVGYVGYNLSSGSNGTDLQFEQPTGYPYPYRGETEQFTVNKPAGLSIVMVRLRGPIPKVNGLAFQFFFHNFAQEKGTKTYGQDVGLTLSYAPPFDKRWVSFIRAAHFFQTDATAGGPTNTTRVIVGTEYSWQIM